MAKTEFSIPDKIFPARPNLLVIQAEFFKWIYHSPSLGFSVRIEFFKQEQVYYFPKLKFGLDRVFYCPRPSFRTRPNFSSETKFIIFRLLADAKAFGPKWVFQARSRLLLAEAESFGAGPSLPSQTKFIISRGRVFKTRPSVFKQDWVSFST